MRTIIALLIVLFMISSTAIAWYPEYSVMASDFVVGRAFLAPSSYHSMSVYALGDGFTDLYDSPLDNIGINPAAAMNMDSKHYFHLDLAGQEFFGGEMESGRGIMPYYDSYYPYPWSYYQQNEEKVDYEPAFRLVYLGYPISALKNTRLGFSVDWMYELSEFYQPYDIWGFGYRDAFGAEYANDEVDPYDDYRLRQAGDDENTNEGYNLTFFLAHPLTSRTDIGVRFTSSTETVDGNLRDYNFNDQSDYRDVYLSFNESNTTREQSFTSSDIMLGVNTKLDDDTEFGISLGMLNADMDRVFNEQDSSNYYSMSYDQYPDLSADDSSYYISSSDHESAKNWLYDGQTLYSGLQYRTKGSNGVSYRFSVYAEQRKGDLTETESLYQSNNYRSRYFYYYDSTVSEYYSTTWATVERTGTGVFEQSLLRGSAGIDWAVSPSFRFLGGIYLNKRERLQTSTEPFTGEKYSYWDRSDNYYNPGIDIRHQEDEQEYSWERIENEMIVGLPVGFVLDFGKYFQLNSGLTKIFRKTEITETYDVIVFRRLIEDGDGTTTTTTEDNNFVEGFKFPDIKTFDNTLIFNTGLSFIFADNFAATVVLSKAFDEEYLLKIGGQVSW